MTGIISEMGNYLIPASGAPRCYQFSQTMVAEQNYEVDFRSIALDGKDFRPYGMFIDNTRGAAPLEFLIQGVNFAGFVAAGEFLMTPYPAPMNQVVTLRGAGQVTVLFVDFPVMPFSTAQFGQGGGGGGSIDIKPVTDALALLVTQESFERNSNEVETNQLQIIAAFNAFAIDANANARETIDRMVKEADLMPMLGAMRSYLATIAGNSGGGGGADPTPLLTQIEDNTYSALGKLDQIRSAVNGLQGPLGDLNSAIMSMHSAYALFDSDGNPLPANFGSLGRAYEYDAGGNIEAETRTDGLYFIWRKTYAYNADKLISESAWVRTSI